MQGHPNRDPETKIKGRSLCGNVSCYQESVVCFFMITHKRRWLFFRTVCVRLLLVLLNSIVAKKIKHGMHGTPPSYQKQKRNPVLPHGDVRSPKSKWKIQQGEQKTKSKAASLWGCPCVENIARTDRSGRCTNRQSYQVCEAVLGEI